MPLSSLIVAPFSLTQGTSIQAKVIAANQFGDSEISAAGNGGIVVVIPFNIQLANNYDVTNTTHIGLLFPTNNGGMPILEYKVYWGS